MHLNPPHMRKQYGYTQTQHAAQQNYDSMMSQLKFKLWNISIFLYLLYSTR